MSVQKIGLFVVMAAASVVFLSGKAQAGQCTDPWVTQAITEATGGAPVDNGGSGACNIQNYNYGHWNSYPELAGYVRTHFNGNGTACSDPWVTQAITEVTGRAHYSSECNIQNFNNGQWGSYSNLVGYVRSYVSQGVIGYGGRSLTGGLTSGGNNGLLAGGVTGAGAGLVSTNGGNVIAAGAGNVLGNSAAGVIAAGAGNAVNRNGSNVIAAGAGNVRNQNGSNVIAAGAGN